MRVWLAVRAFFVVLFDRSVAERVRIALDHQPTDAPDSRQSPVMEHEPNPVTPPAKDTERGTRGTRGVPGGRHEAITLMATLQREARLLDLVQEPLGDYSDAQIGAAAREVLRNCATVVERLFALQPVVQQEEGSDFEVPRGYDPLQYRVVGSVTGEPPFRGKLMHRGWIATRCELPAWSGSAQAANVIAPVEVEVP